MNPADRLELSDLVHRYAAGVDDRRFDDVVDLFTGDATLTVPDPPRTLEPAVAHHGPAEIGQAVASVAQTERTIHAILSEIYTAATQSVQARGRVTCIAHHFTRRDQRIEVGRVTWRRCGEHDEQTPNGGRKLVDGRLR